MAAKSSKRAERRVPMLTALSYTRSNEDRQGPAEGGRMRSRIRATLAFLIATAAAAPVVLAHHGISNWDLNKDVTLEGTITEFDFINPHSWLHLNVKGPDGKTQAWECEMRSANA